MALSNWDTISANEKGESISGFWKSPQGVGVEIYKNWMYIHDEKAWTESGCFTKPIIMQIEEGVMNYKDVQIVAFRGPQNGIYLVVSHTRYPKYKGKVKTVGMIGIGCYGYKGDKFVGVLPSSVDWFMKMLNATHKEVMIGSKTCGDGKWEETEYEYETETIIIPNCFRKIDLKKCYRFNQGDMYFNKHIKTNPQITKPGKAQNTICHKLLTGNNK
jgi:hypothetical protein